MLYILLKNIIETTIQNYRCEVCSGSLQEISISIKKLSEQSIDLECICPACQTASHVHIQIGDMKNAMGNAGLISKNSNKNSIKDEDIVKISEDLLRIHSIEDLLR